MWGQPQGLPLHLSPPPQRHGAAADGFRLDVRGHAHPIEDRLGSVSTFGSRCPVMRYSHSTKRVLGVALTELRTQHHDQSAMLVRHALHLRQRARIGDVVRRERGHDGVKRRPIGTAAPARGTAPAGPFTPACRICCCACAIICGERSIPIGWPARSRQRDQQVPRSVTHFQHARPAHAIERGAAPRLPLPKRHQPRDGIIREGELVIEQVKCEADEAARKSVRHDA